MCAMSGDRVLSSVNVSMIANRVPRPFLHAHQRRPRFGMSDRRPSSPKRRLALIPTTAGYDFLPLAAARPFLAQAKKVVPWLPSTACRPLRGAGRSPPVCRQPSRPRWAARETERTRQWRPSAPSPRPATASPARFAPSRSMPRPSWLAWQKTARDTERDYLSVKLDDPSFPAPIYATLIEVEGQEGLQLIWSRPSRD